MAKLKPSRRLRELRKTLTPAEVRIIRSYFGDRSRDGQINIFNPLIVSPEDVLEAYDHMVRMRSA